MCKYICVDIIKICADAIATYLYVLSCYRYRFLATLIKGMRTPFQMFSWKPGGGRAGEAVHFVWRVPLDKIQQDNNKTFRLQVYCLADITTYHTRVKKAVFFATVVH